MPAAGTVRAPVQRGPRTGTTKLSLITQAANELKQVILKNLPAGPQQTSAVRLVSEAESVATSGIMYNGA